MHVELSRTLTLAARLRLWKPAILVGRAGGALSAEMLPEARLCLGEALRRAPGWAEPYYLMGRLAAVDEQASRDEEEAWYAAALERDPRHRRAEQALLALRAWRHEPLVLAWHLFYADRPVAAHAAFDRAIAAIGRRAPEATRADALAGIGWCHHSLGDYSDARQAFAAALLLKPDLTHAAKGLGICCYFLGRYAEAERALAVALSLNPELRDAQSFIGWCAYARGDWPRALGLFSAACAGNPLLADPRWGEAWSNWRLGRLDAAREAFSGAIRLGPGHPSRWDFHALFARDQGYAELIGLLGRSLVGVGLAEDALRVLESCARTAAVAGHQALALLALERPAEAHALLSAGEDLALDEPFDETDRDGTHMISCRVIRARAALAVGREDAALTDLAEAVRVRPELAQARLELAELLLYRDEREPAARNLAAARAAGLSGSRVRRGLDELARRGRDPLLDALELLVGGEPTAALERIESLTEVDPADAAAVAALRGRALLRLGRRAEAMEALANCPEDIIPAAAGGPGGRAALGVRWRRFWTRSKKSVCA